MLYQPIMVLLTFNRFKGRLELSAGLNGLVKIKRQRTMNNVVQMR